MIHLVVRPIGVSHNPDNGKYKRYVCSNKGLMKLSCSNCLIDEPSRNSQRRISTRHEGYAVITLDATLSDLEDGNSVRR